MPVFSWILLGWGGGCEMICGVKKVIWFTESCPIKVVHSLKMFHEYRYSQSLLILQSSFTENVHLSEGSRSQRPGQDALPRRQIVYWIVELMKLLPVSDADRKGD